MTGEESCREKSTRDKGEEEDEKFGGNDSETGAKFRHAPFSRRFSYSSRKRSFPRGSINNKDTSFYRIVRANQSQVADRDLFALLYYELITDKQRSTPCADITRRKKINACQSNPRLQGDERSFTEKKREMWEAASDAKRATNKSFVILGKSRNSCRVLYRIFHLCLIHLRRRKEKNIFRY